MPHHVVRIGAGLLLAVAGLLARPDVSAAGALDSAAPPFRKLGRGLANIATGIVELPAAIRAVDLAEGPAAAATVGVLKGSGSAALRMAVGAVEALTFMFPLGDTGYEPILYPEFLLQPNRHR